MIPIQNNNKQSVQAPKRTDDDFKKALAGRMKATIDKGGYQSGKLLIDDVNSMGLNCEYRGDDQSFTFRVRDLSFPFSLNDYMQDVPTMAEKVYDFYKLITRTIDLTTNYPVGGVFVRRKANQKRGDKTPRT